MIYVSYFEDLVLKLTSDKCDNDGMPIMALNLGFFVILMYSSLNVNKVNYTYLIIMDWPGANMYSSLPQGTQNPAYLNIVVRS